MVSQQFLMTKKAKLHTYTINNNPLGVIICSKINGLDIGQDTEIQYLEVAKQTNIYVKYSKKLF